MPKAEQIYSTIVLGFRRKSNSSDAYSHNSHDKKSFSFTYLPKFIYAPEIYFGCLSDFKSRIKY